MRDAVLIGNAIGPCRVLPKLGEGGMGEVYRARDTKLDRDVALPSGGTRIVAQSLSSEERRTLIEGGADARYGATGHLLYAVDGVVYAVPFDPRDPRPVTTTGVPVLEGVRRAVSSTTAGAQFSVSNSGLLVYVSGPAKTLEEFSHHEDDQ